MHDSEHGDPNTPDDSLRSKEVESFSFPPEFEKLFEDFCRTHIDPVDPKTFWGAGLAERLSAEIGFSEVLALGFKSVGDEFGPAQDEDPLLHARTAIDEEESLRRLAKVQQAAGDIAIVRQREEEAEHVGAIADLLRIDMLGHIHRVVPEDKRDALDPREILRRGYRARFAKLLSGGARLEALFSPASHSKASSKSAEYSDGSEMEPYDVRHELSPEILKTTTKNIGALIKELRTNSNLDFKKLPLQAPALAKFYTPELFRSFVSDERSSAQFKTRCEQALKNAADQSNFEDALAAAVNLMLLYPDEYSKDSILTNTTFLGTLNTVDSAVEDSFGQWLQEGKNDQVFLSLLFSKLFFDVNTFRTHMSAAEAKIRGSILGLKTGALEADEPGKNPQALTAGLYTALITNGVVVHNDRFEITPPEDRPHWL
jgi:hypothetical protein